MVKHRARMGQPHLDPFQTLSYFRQRSRALIILGTLPSAPYISSIVMHRMAYTICDAGAVQGTKDFSCDATILSTKLHNYLATPKLLLRLGNQRPQIPSRYAENALVCDRCCITPFQHYAFRGDMGTLRPCIGALD